MNKHTTKALQIILFICFSTIYNIQAQSIKSKTMNTTYETATLGGGCYWCTEAIYSQINGVECVTSGFAGGTTVNPSYKEVCTGNTGHAEVVQIVFDNQIISYKEILEIFWHVHDPTTLNRQGEDIGTQYRSVIFFHSSEQQKIAEEMKDNYNNINEFDGKIVTEIVPYTTFYKAEDYHQDYYENHSTQPYCSAVISPKIKKFRKKYEQKLKRSDL
jgi:methionine-S-sulfoxide reductase